MSFASTDRQMTLRRRDGGGVVTFVIAPETISDSREMKPSNDSDEGESPDQMTIVKVAGYSPREITFTATFDNNYHPQRITTDPHTAAERLRSWQTPDFDAKEPELKGNPPVLVFTGYDIMECFLMRTDFTIRAYHPEVRKKIWVMDAALKLVQYVPEESPKRAWQGLGGTFNEVNELSAEVEERQRTRSRSRIQSQIDALVIGVDKDIIKEEQKRLQELVTNGVLTNEEVRQISEQALQGFFKDNEDLNSGKRSTAQGNLTSFLSPFL